MVNPNVLGLHAAVVEQPITETLETNYMPYAMSVIVSRAIPEIDGFKPSHRKLLYTMYKMGLLNGGRTKSANIVGQTCLLYTSNPRCFRLRTIFIKYRVKTAEPGRQEIRPGSVFCTRIRLENCGDIQRLQNAAFFSKMQSFLGRSIVLEVEGTVESKTVDPPI